MINIRQAVAGTPSPLIPPGLSETKFPNKHTPLPTYEVLQQVGIPAANETKRTCESILREEFGTVLLPRKLIGETPERQKVVMAQWRRVMRLFAETGLGFEALSETPEAVYRNFLGQSPDYIGKCMGVLNQFGDLLSRRSGTRFFPVPLPKGATKQKLAATYGGPNSSLPLTPALLEEKGKKLRRAHYNWLFITMWMGLRPSELEADKLRADTNGVWVYQSKLVRIPEARRWKLIPALLPEQEEALRLISAGAYKKPSCETIAHHFGEGYFQYAGRKGFAALLLERDLPIELISNFLGHNSIETTINFYADPIEVQRRQVGKIIQDYKIMQMNQKM